VPAWPGRARMAAKQPRAARDARRSAHDFMRHTGVGCRCARRLTASGRAPTIRRPARVRPYERVGEARHPLPIRRHMWSPERPTSAPLSRRRLSARQTVRAAVSMATAVSSRVAVTRAAPQSGTDVVHAVAADSGPLSTVTYRTTNRPANRAPGGRPTNDAPSLPGRHADAIDSSHDVARAARADRRRAHRKPHWRPPRRARRTRQTPAHRRQPAPPARAAPCMFHGNVVRIPVCRRFRDGQQGVSPAVATSCRGPRSWQSGRPS
jgi:hypothetical protein